MNTIQFQNLRTEKRQEILNRLARGRKAKKYGLTSYRSVCPVCLSAPMTPQYKGNYFDGTEPMENFITHFECPNCGHKEEFL